MNTINKQDRQGARTPADLERKYQLGTLDVRFAEVMGIATDARKLSAEASAAVGEVSNIVAKISEEVDSIAITVEDLDTGKLADLSVRIDGITASVSECATKEELDGYVTHEKLSSELKVTTDAITASVAADYVKNDTLNGYVTSEKLSSELELTQQSITAAVEADYVKSDTLTGYATKSELEITTNQIKQSVSETYTTQDEFGTYQESVTGEFVIGIINKESVAKISADRLDIEGELLNIKVDHTNIEGKITAEQIEVDDLSALGATIGGWNIDKTCLSYTLESGVGTGFQPPNHGSWAIAVGYTNFNDWSTAPFRVNHQGVLCCSNKFGTMSTIIEGGTITVSSSLRHIGDTEQMQYLLMQFRDVDDNLYGLYAFGYLDEVGAFAPAGVFIDRITE